VARREAGSVVQRKDLTGWEALEKDRKFGWTVENGVLKAPGEAPTW